jgi:hypothetical protein
MRWENTVEIDAPAETVWQLTLAVTGWPDFTPTMTSVERLDAGPLRVGSQARIKQPGQSKAVWTVTRLDPARRFFAWQTRRIGLTMLGSHLVEDRGQGCRNTLGIELTGRGAGLFWFLFGALIRRSLVTENASFRARAQSSVRG